MNLSIVKERIDEVIQVDTTANTEADFLATHVPFKNIKIKNGGGRNSIFSMTTEEQIFDDYIKDPGNRHQFIIVQGSSGSGKSHLIRWFATKFNTFSHPNETVIFIRRSDNSLKGTIRQLLDLEEVANLPNKEIYKRLSEAGSNISGTELKNDIFYAFLSKMTSDIDGKGDTTYLSNIQKKKLRALFNNEEFRKRMTDSDDLNSPIERIFRKVVPSENTKGINDRPALFELEDFYIDQDFVLDLQNQEADRKAIQMATDLLDIESDNNELRQNVVSYLNQFVDSIIQSIAKLEPGDFENIFTEIRRELYRRGKNLTLLIEDVTAFTGVNASLLNVLTDIHTGTAELNGKNICRLSSVVGTTTQYYNEFRDNFTDRISHEIYIEDDALTSETNSDSLIEFVAKYVNAINLDRSVLQTWKSEGANDYELPIHSVEEDERWDFVRISSGQTVPLYPFTKNAIINLTKVLTDDHRTPRYVLTDVIDRTMKDIVYHRDSFPSFTLDASAYRWKDAMHRSHMLNQAVNDNDRTRLNTMICVWGDASADSYEIDGVKYLSGLPEIVFKHVGLTGLYGIDTKAPEKQKAPLVEPAIIPQQQPVITNKDNSDFLKLKDMLSNWVNGGDFIDPRNDFRGVVNDFVKSAIDWQDEGVSFDSLNKATSHGYELVTIARNTRNSKGLYEIKATDEANIVLEAFAKWQTLGKKSWNFEGSELGIYQVTKWIRSIKDDIVKAVNVRLGKDDIDYAEYALSYSVFSMLLRNHPLRKGNVYIDILKDESSEMRQGIHSKEWNDALTRVMSGNSNKDAFNAACNYFNIKQDNGNTNLVFVNKTRLDKSINCLKRCGFILNESIEGLENDSSIDKKSIVEKTTDLYPILKTVVEKEDKFVKDYVSIICEAFDEEDLTLLGPDNIDDLINELDRYIDMVKKADRTYCINSIDMVIKRRVNDNKEKICTAAHIIGESLEKNTVFDKMFGYSNNPLGVLEDLKTLIEQINISMASFKNEYEKNVGTKESERESYLKPLAESALNRTEEIQKLWKELGVKHNAQ